MLKIHQNTTMQPSFPYLSDIVGRLTTKRDKNRLLQVNLVTKLSVLTGSHVRIMGRLRVKTVQDKYIPYPEF